MCASANNYALGWNINYPFMHYTESLQFHLVSHTEQIVQIWANMCYFVVSKHGSKDAIIVTYAAL